MQEGSWWSEPSGRSDRTSSCGTLKACLKSAVDPKNSTAQQSLRVWNIISTAQTPRLGFISSALRVSGSLPVPLQRVASVASLKSSPE